MTDETVTAGHNSQGGTMPAEGDFLRHYARWCDRDKRRKALKDEEKAHKKEMQLDGIRMDMFAEFVKLNEMDTDAVAERFAHLGAYLRFGRHPIGSQLPLDMGGAPEDLEGDDDAIEARARETAAAEGFRAGVLNEPADCGKYDVTTALGQEWLTSYGEGVKFNLREQQDLPPISEPET